LPCITEPPLHCGSVNTLTLAFPGNREETVRNGQVGQVMVEIECLARKFSRESRGSWHFLLYAPLSTKQFASGTVSHMYMY
jgi:hypothetical protein